ncbi:MAG: prepilin-type N-terminal cleavage/methylation domain-containing protein [Lachnospiraceae bacterium]|nr:prepilin-type N-terminal cleavage/methylation domain-containing protein [Lachnospiraceae bacterium]
MKIQRNHKGFTLVEILIAVSILAIAVVPMLANFVSSSKVNSKSKVTMNGTIVAQNIMEGINAYGVEETIIQLENTHDPAPDLKFMPSSMIVENWGRCTFAVEEVENTRHEFVKRPKYDADSYQDNNYTSSYSTNKGQTDFKDTIQMLAREMPGAYLENSHELNTSYAMKYAYKSERDGKVYFINDSMKRDSDNAHAYMFWLENVQYGSKKYDVLLTMDANYYRDHATNELKTTLDMDAVVPVDSSNPDATSNTVRNKITNSSDPNKFYYKRTYNDTMMSRINNNIGTAMSLDDTTPDRYNIESWTLDTVASNFLIKCRAGVTKEQILKGLERDIFINIKQEANPSDATKPYKVITVEYKYVVNDNSLLPPGTAAGSVSQGSGVTEIFRSCEKSPRNIFIYYTPNYAPFPGGSGKDTIHITNTAGEADGSGNLGTDLNLFLIRQTDLDFEHDSTTDLSVNESRYKVQVELDEKLKGNQVKNLRTHVYTNIGYNLADDQKMGGTGGSGMGEYKFNGTSVTEDYVKKELRFGGLDGINLEEGSNEEDYIYDVTVQVFKAGQNYDQSARIAKFTGSSN